MNRLEHWFCGSSIWHWVTRTQVLPWLTAGSNLGDHLLELGAGPGAATIALRNQVQRVTSLEYDAKLVAKLRIRTDGTSGDHATCQILQGDASTLPFPDATFSSAIAVLMLHHLPCREQQDRTFAEIRRVLRPGGVFLAVEIPDGWLNRVMHTRSTFVPIAPASVPARLAAAGFWRSSIDFRSSAFRIRALRAWSDAGSERDASEESCETNALLLP
jgi:ubiquinone/menaquinone biosynthesis C-methylase UbiE